MFRRTLFLFSVAWTVALGGCGDKRGFDNGVQSRGPERLPVLFRLAKDTPQTYGALNFSTRDAVLEAMAIWNEAAGRPVFALAHARHLSTSTTLDPHKALIDGVNVIYFMANRRIPSLDPTKARTSSRDVLGVCYRQLPAADIVLALSTPDYPAPGDAATASEPTVPTSLPRDRAPLEATDVLLAGEQGKQGYDLTSVIVHELGHALGMGHDMIHRASVMWGEGLDVGTMNRRLSASDKELLMKIMATRFEQKISLELADDPEESVAPKQP